MKEYKWEIYEIHEEEILMVANGSSRNKKDAEKELNHYALQYAQDYPIKIKKNWEIPMKTIKSLKDNITDRNNCSAIIKIDEKTEKIKIGKKIYTKKNLKVLIDDNLDKVYIYEGNKLKSILSYELFKSAKEIISVWFGGYYEVWATDEIDNPIMFVNKPMGIFIAPRIEIEEENFNNG